MDGVHQNNYDVHRKVKFNAGLHEECIYAQYGLGSNLRFYEERMYQNHDVQQC